MKIVRKGSQENLSDVVANEHLGKLNVSVFDLYLGNSKLQL